MNKIKTKKILKKRRKDATHYVKNDDLLPLLIEFRKKRLEFLEKEKSGELIGDEEIPRIPDAVGEAIYMISHKLSNSPNFSNYPFKDEMIGDAIENCLKVIDNFDPEKSNNPFAYFTQIAYWAFVRKIKKEQKYLYIKYKSIENFLKEQEGSADVSLQAAAAQYGTDYADLNMRKYIEDYESKQKIKTSKTSKKQIKTLI